MASETSQDLQLRKLRVFVALAECGVMSVAGAHLGITQARVSQTIRAMEISFGTELFSRDRRPLELTRTGQILYEKARTMLELEEEIWGTVRTITKTKRPLMHIAAPTTFVDVVFGHLFPTISDLADQWRVSNGLTPDHVKKFLSRQIDMVITIDELLEQQSNISRHELLREPYVIVVPADSESNPNLSELIKSKPLIRYIPESGTGLQMIRHLARLKLDPIEVVEIESVFAQMTLISNNRGWGLTTPLCYASAPSFHSKVRLEPIVQGAFRRQINLISRSSEDSISAARIAAACRDVLSVEVFSDILTDYPWLEEKFDFYQKKSRQ